MSRLLRFLVDHKFLEEGKPLTAYAVAVDGLGRDDGFDTQIDSYPRVQIGRLRRMLDHFYLREKSDKRLFIPYHHYEIILGPDETAESEQDEPVDPEANGESSTDPSTQPIAATTNSDEGMRRFGRGNIFAVVVAIIALSIGTIYYLQETDTVKATTIAYPAIIVKGADGIVNSSSNAKIEITHSYLVGALEKFDQVRIFDEDANSTNLSQYLLESSILNEAADRMQLRLVDSSTREVIWSSRVEVTTTKEREAGLDQAVIDIAGPYGKIAQHELSKYRDDFTPGYPCLLQFHEYMRYRDPALLEPALRCMEASAEQFPNDSFLMSMLAVAKNLFERFDTEDENGGPGKDFALSAVKLDQNSASATFAVAQSAFFEGDCRRGVSWGERAVSLNPLNSRLVGYLGIYMLVCNMPEGQAYASKALEMDANADPAIAAALAIQKLRDGNPKAAQELASEYMDSMPSAVPELEISYILASAMLGEKEEARKAWRRLAERSDFPETAEPGEVLGRWFANPELVQEMAAAFKKSGLY